MRVISGIYKNRNLLTPGEGTHPMGSRERMAIFNVLMAEIPGARVLDAYAGSGALGIEALSRGAEFVCFIEKNAKAAGVIKKNLATLGVPREKYKIIKEKAENVNFSDDFDVIFADPPYEKVDLMAIKNLANGLRTGGALVFSHPKMENYKISGLKIVKNREYAAARIDFLNKV